MDAIEQFKGAMRAHDLNPPEVIEPGKLHRFSANGRARDDAGWCKLFADCEGGVFGDFRSGLSETWQARRERSFTPAEREDSRRRCEAERQEREAEQARRHAEARDKARSLWKAAMPARADHPYLVRKGISPVDTLREIPAGEAVEILGYVPKSSGEELLGRLLVVPVKVGDALSTLELIDGDGRKSALYGGAKAGGYWEAQSLREGDGADRTLLIGEGVATALSAREATEHPAFAALSCGNLEPAAKAMRDLYPKAVIVILADLVKATGEPDSHAIEAARAIGGRVAVPDFGANRPDGATDFNDMTVHRGLEAVERAIAGANAPGANRAAASKADAKDWRAAVERLSKLSAIDYDRAREAEAQALGVRVTTLDKEVEKLRPKAVGGVDGQGAAPLFAEVDPWPHPVNGAKLLEDLAAAFLRYVFMPLTASTILALWVIHTFCYDLRRCTPILGLTSPQKRCGKTTLMSLLLSVSNRPLAASNISPSCVFRSIDLWHPTLLIDEADSFLRDNEELRGILNSGHTRDLAYVVRNTGDEHEPRQFSTWAPKALALIGKLPPTLHDRAIVVELARKTPGELVERLAGFDGADLRRRCLRWAKDNAETVRAADPCIPPGTHDRAADNWAPLLAIADAAGGDWPARARQALAAQPDELDDSVAVMLLADIRQFFEDSGEDRALTANLVDYLTGIEERPWSDWRRGKPLTANQLARLLAPFKIKPAVIRVGAHTPRGYTLDAFEDAFTRYLTPSLPIKGKSIRNTATMASRGHSSDFQAATSDTNVADQYQPKPAPDIGCCGVAGQITPDRETGVI